MKAAPKKPNRQRSRSASAQNGHKVLDPEKWYAPGEPMSEADRATFEAWKKVYANRERYLELMK